MLIRQQRFDLRMVQKLGHELGEYLAALQPVAVLREHGRVPHQVVGRKSHEPAVQKIVVQLLHQLAFRPDAVEHLHSSKALSNCSGGIEGRPSLVSAMRYRLRPASTSLFCGCCYHWKIMSPEPLGTWR